MIKYRTLCTGTQGQTALSPLQIVLWGIETIDYVRLTISMSSGHAARMTNHSELIDQWPSIAELARDMGTDYETVRAWRRRERIPVEYWRDLLVAARGRRIKLSLDELVPGTQ